MPNPNSRLFDFLIIFDKKFEIFSICVQVLVVQDVQKQKKLSSKQAASCFCFCLLLEICFSVYLTLFYYFFLLFKFFTLIRALWRRENKLVKYLLKIFYFNFKSIKKYFSFQTCFLVCFMFLGLTRSL